MAIILLTEITVQTEIVLNCDKVISRKEYPTKTAQASSFCPVPVN